MIVDVPNFGTKDVKKKKKQIQDILSLVKGIKHFTLNLFLSSDII